MARPFATLLKRPASSGKLGALLLGVWLLAAAPWAWGAGHVALVLSEEGGAYAEVADKIRMALTQKTQPAPRFSLLSLEAFGEKLRAPASLDADVVVAIGSAAAQAAATNPRVPVLSVLVPKAAFERVAAARGRADPARFSAVYLDQPIARQLQLVRAVLPGRLRLGVLASAQSGTALAQLRTATRDGRFKLAVEKIDRQEEIVPALNRLLHDNDVLFSFPDPLIYNRYTVQDILLTTYRYRVPVIGFSPSYVKAGALAAVYSTPAQIGQQVAEILYPLLQDPGRGLPAPQFPKYFSVSVNYQVARSLGIEIEDEAALHGQLGPQVEP
ncbi:MAG: hypothetical protein K8F27_07300 [Sulfuricellaceae bacterium]|nr:hypothetical protein [Sulfuricellaceae bacterium]